MFACMDACMHIWLNGRVNGRMDMYTHLHVHYLWICVYPFQSILGNICRKKTFPANDSHSKGHRQSWNISWAKSARKNKMILVWAAFTLESNSGKFLPSFSPRPIRCRFHTHGGMSTFLPSLHHLRNPDPSLPIKMFPVSDGSRIIPYMHRSGGPPRWRTPMGWGVETW